MFMLNVKNFPWYLNKISTLEQGRISRENDFNVFATFNKNTEMNQMAHPSQIQYNSLKIYVNYQVIEGNMSKKRKRKIFIILFSFRGKNSKTCNIIIFHYQCYWLKLQNLIFLSIEHPDFLLGNRISQPASIVSSVLPSIHSFIELWKEEKEK